MASIRGSTLGAARKNWIKNIQIEFEYGYKISSDYIIPRGIARNKVKRATEWG